jgi:hypothetical protein
MQRDEVLDLLLLEADGGLSEADAARLDQALSKDPTLRDERSKLLSSWADIRDLGRSLKLRPDFGEDRLAALRNPRREGVLIGGQVRAAAAALLFATLLRGAIDPRAAVVYERVGNASEAAGERTTGVLRSGSSIEPAQGEAVHVAAIDGLTCSMREGSVELSADGVVRVDPGAADIEIAIGERTARVELGNVVLFGANAVLHVSGDSILARQFDVLAGTVRVGGFAGRTISSRDGALALKPDGGLTAVAPGGSGSISNDPTFGAKRSETTPAIDPPASDPSGNAAPIVAADRSFAPAHVHGLVSTSDESPSPIPGATVRLTPDLLPGDSLALLLPSDEEGRLAALRDFDLARFGLGAPISVVTGADGSYDLPEVPPGTWRVDVLSPDKPLRCDQFGRFIQVQAGADVPVDVALDAGANISGRVVDRYGHSIAGAMLDDGARVVFTDHYGKFVLHNAPTAGISVFVRAEGFEDLDATLQGNGSNRISLVAATAISGVIRDAAGDPILGRIEAGFELDGAWRVERASVDRDGLFSLKTIPLGVAVRLVASSSGHETASTFLDVGADRSQKVYFDLASSGTVTVYPYDTGLGRPLDTAAVFALAPDELVAGVEHAENLTLDGLDPNLTNHAISWAPGLRITSFDVAPNVDVLHVDLDTARERHLQVLDDRGRDLSGALVLWGARPRDSTRFLALVPAVRTDDGFELPDFGLDGGNLNAEIVIVANGQTVIVVDDPLRDETTVSIAPGN